ncbi:MAG TPA: hypothetical protein VFS90_23695 [Pyrinomonadaceae bacterium]|nr:hypothetical protein [Pyrinomonadaceae bacterium]
MPTPINQVYAGTLNDFNDSMAQEIEIALNALSGPLPSEPPKMRDDRRKLFIAIANGVINHLRNHPRAIQVDLVGSDHITTINVRFI